MGGGALGALVGVMWAWWLRAVGLVLLLAAVLKLHALLGDPLASHSLLASPRAELLVIQLEAVLGLALVGGVARLLVWLASLGFFAVVLGVAAYQGWTGQSHCGCLGRVEVHPWTMAVFDAVVLAGLLLAYPRAGQRQDYSGPGKLVRRLAVLGLVLVVLLGGMVSATPSPARTLAWLRGQPLLVQPFVSELGEGRPGEWRAFRLQILNFSDQPVRILGGSKNCGVQATESLPVNIPVGGSAELTVLGRFTGEPGRFQQQFVLYTDSRQQPVIFARFAGRVVEPSQSEPP
jgi:hypothetical protein